MVHTPQLAHSEVGWSNAQTIAVQVLPISRSLVNTNLVRTAVSKINQLDLLEELPSLLIPSCWQWLQQGVELKIQNWTHSKGNTHFHYFILHSLAQCIFIRSSRLLPSSCTCNRHGPGGIGTVFNRGRPTHIPRPHITFGLSISDIGFSTICTLVFLDLVRF